MSQELMDYISARHDVILAALELLTAEYRLSDHLASALAVKETESRAVQASRKLASAVYALPRDRRPVGWDKVPATSKAASEAFWRFTVAALRVMSAERAEETPDAASEAEYANDLLCHAARDLAAFTDAKASASAEAKGFLL